MQGNGILSDLYRSINDVKVTTFEESIDVLNGAEITGEGWGSAASLFYGRNPARHGIRYVYTNDGSVLPACDAVTFRRKVVPPSSGILCSDARQ
jgi:hypothetical protein